MSQKPLTQFERTQALLRFGYTKAEAAFLCTAALHSGYFLRRQYAGFISVKDGGSVSQLIERALAAGHVKTSTWLRNIQLYHLCARPFYEALGQGDNRHRRTRTLLATKTKIMGLDYVLAHTSHHYLATDREKLDYFTETLKVDTSVLPAKLYSASRSELTTIRYFVEKYPLFLVGSDRPHEPPVVTFSYIDEGAATLSGYETFLRHYLRLFASLQRFAVLFIADSNRHFAAAAQVFERILGGTQAGAIDPLISRRLEYFKMRRLFEAKELASFDRSKLIRLRQDQRDFASETDEALYELWKVGGEAAVLQKVAPETGRSSSISGSFSTFLLEHDYGLFGRFPG
jgi:hypothetical protein